jgi:hypothetical protein
MVPDSPEDIRIPVPPSGFVSPMNGIGTPQEGDIGDAQVKDQEGSPDVQHLSIRR